ncbi:hypothetical protein [Pukyongiella litopenaei]|uniref:Arginine transporter n=1 Tax=Pukyongiella litopenaei TaxID=2605946 RepID=A0A2S0MST3_9RHOB|nr:hypothetical protein [Pukyongiella litopenaei]AVO38743.1 hypothetical protein C6Y53_14280 [Pukyongiella litopenaei]
MDKRILGAVCAGGLMMLAGVAQAGVIERACRASDRAAATRQMCSCIQSVANKHLSRSEQRKASKFFADPHMAQEVRQSDKRSDEVLWKRYKAFGRQAAQTCR